MAKKLINPKITENLVLSLFKQGFNVFAISDEVGLSIDEIKSILKANGINDFNPVVKNEKDEILQKIINEKAENIGQEVIITSERERYKKYALLEEKCLNLMLNLLDFYSKEPNGDLKVDYLKQQIANNFIKATQEVRAELLKKYEIDKDNENKDDKKIQIEFL